MSRLNPTIVPLGDSAVLLRFGTELNDDANQRAICVADELSAHPPIGALEITPNLISVLVRYDAAKVGFDEICGELRLSLAAPLERDFAPTRKKWKIGVSYGGVDGPDLLELAATLNVTSQKFIDLHAETGLRVLATGFAPGFVYCGFHHDLPAVPRRKHVRRQVSAGSILFAAGQTAITATSVPTGWHVIGRTNFCNFDVDQAHPTQLNAGDGIAFYEAAL